MDFLIQVSRTDTAKVRVNIWERDTQNGVFVDLSVKAALYIAYSIARRAIQCFFMKG